MYKNKRTSELLREIEANDGGGGGGAAANAAAAAGGGIK